MSEERTLFGSYLGEYRRRRYECRACGKGSWVDQASTYGSTRAKEERRPQGIHNKQSRGLYELCQHCYEVDLRLMKVLREAGYSHIGRDDVHYEGDGIFSMIVWFIEPESNMAVD
jgi:hypothetical protein